MSRMTLFGAIVTMLTGTLLTFGFLLWAMWDDPWHYWPVYVFLAIGCASAILSKLEDRAERERQLAQHEQRMADILRSGDEAVRRMHLRR